MSRLPGGLYQPGTSIFYRLDPRAKIIGFLLLTVSVIATDTISGYVIWLLVLPALAAASGLSADTLFDMVRRMMFFFIVILLMNTCFFSPKDAWISFGILNPSPAGLQQGLQVVVRVLLILIISNILMVTTAPMELTRALETLLAPLRTLRVPTDQIALILSVAMQFIPTLMEETDAIKRAQTARGARFDSPRLKEKATAVFPLLIPVFLSAFKRADELSMAMEARGYRMDCYHRRKKQIPWHKRDYAAIFLCIVLCGLEVGLRYI